MSREEDTDLSVHIRTLPSEPQQPESKEGHGEGKAGDVLNVNIN